ncbi:MAG TPA: hypothetical protein VJY62_11935 [Bacteroidia bacterium]|nr:hypothetical protein [Bacteroidia bacterium]
MKKSKKKTKEPLPGYPHYPESEDIMNREERANTDVENLSRSHGGRNSELKEHPPVERYKDATPEIVPGTEADLTRNDLFSLGPVDRDQDEGEDETLLPSLKIGPDLSGDDLDVPGSELDDEAESRGSEDEENNYYSRGQD